MRLAFLVSTTLFSGACAAEPPSQVSHTAVTAFDHAHTTFTDVLQAHVRDGSVDYTALKKSGRLNAYTAQLEAVDSVSGWTSDQQLAFWINAYNAYTLELIVDRMPVASIRDIHWPLSPWKIDFISLTGKSLSLDTIEHETIRKDFEEPRIHFALVCASKGCPELRDRAYTAEGLDAELQTQTRDFLRDTTKNRVDPDALRLSKIFKWYGGDFGGEEGIRRFLRSHLEGVKAQPIEYLEYDWSLNGK